MEAFVSLCSPNVDVIWRLPEFLPELLERVDCNLELWHKQAISSSTLLFTRVCQSNRNETRTCTKMTSFRNVELGWVGRWLVIVGWVKSSKTLGYFPLSSDSYFEMGIVAPTQNVHFLFILLVSEEKLARLLLCVGWLQGVQRQELHGCWGSHTPSLFLLVNFIWLHTGSLWNSFICWNQGYGLNWVKVPKRPKECPRLL